MFDFRLSRDDLHTVLRITGDLRGAEDSDTLTEAFALVERDDHLVVDLQDLEGLDDGAASHLGGLIAGRSIVAETVVIARREAVSTQLVLHGVDDVCTIVPTVSDATAILLRSWRLAV